MQYNRNLKRIIIFIIFYNYIVYGFSNTTENINNKLLLNRSKRKLPLLFHDFGVSQFVCGFGIPVETESYESITSGIVFKSQLPLPSKPSDLRTPTSHNVNGGRDVEYKEDENKLHDNLRWEFYKALELWANSIGLNGHVCVLKTLCEASQIPFNDEIGDLWHQIAHIIFTPSLSSDNKKHPLRRTYLSAVNIGLNPHNDCHEIFKECPKSILNIFTNIL